jgi:hypothetical protein
MGELGMMITAVGRRAGRVIDGEHTWVLVRVSVMVVWVRSDEGGISLSDWIHHHLHVEKSGIQTSRAAAVVVGVGVGTS